jgi:hypothetical protein
VEARSLAHHLKKDLTHKGWNSMEKNYLKSLQKNLTKYDKLPREQQIVFLAGVFDGEGSFGNWSNGKNRKKELQVSVETTDVDMVLRFYKMFDGYFFVLPPQKEGNKNLFRWKLKGNKAWKPLEEMIPYMCTRRREKFYGLVESIRLSSKSWSARLSESSKNKNVDGGCSNETRTKDGRRTSGVSR